MIHLILYIVFSSVFTLCIKWVYNRGTEDVITVGAINYICAALAISVWFFIDPHQTGEINAILTGGFMGLIYFIAFFFVIYCVRSVGASSSTVVGSLSLLMPIVVAAFVWDSIPNGFQVAGIGLAVVSLLLIAVKPSNDSWRSGLEPEATKTRFQQWLPAIVLFSFFLLCGFSRIAQEAFKYESSPDQKPTYLMTAFWVAAVPSIVLLAYRRKRILPMEYVIGTIMGLSNAVQTFFILMALQTLEGFIVFPLSSAGAIVFTTLIATGLLGERLSARTFVGIAIAVIALVLLKYEFGEEEVQAFLRIPQTLAPTR